MGEQKLYQASANWLKSAVDALCAAGVEVLAPTQTDSGKVDLARVTSSEQVIGSYANTAFPLKRLFLPMSEVLLKYEKGENGDVDLEPESAEAKELVILGCRPCDVAALGMLDKVFQWDYSDVAYQQKRDRTTVVSLACTEPSPECFCTSVGGSPQGSEQSDVLVFGNADNTALMQVNTAKGEKFIERLADAVTPAPEGTKLPEPAELERKFNPQKVKGWLDDNFESDFWVENSLGCLGCGTCSYLCPTCHCFDIVDEASWNRGQRRRNWDCCSFSQFTLHASGHNPRPNQAARYRQRLMHKFKYFPERFGLLACVGCGRCLKNCAVGQNLIADLADIESR
ncbi:MAG: hypothetical protein GWP14_09295 [Actinobacteria bacterium]|nr:hypothetical protein [Actinomycetota bacterium]